MGLFDDLIESELQRRKELEVELKAQEEVNERKSKKASEYVRMFSGKLSEFEAGMRRLGYESQILHSETPKITISNSEARVILTYIKDEVHMGDVVANIQKGTADPIKFEYHVDAETLELVDFYGEKKSVDKELRNHFQQVMTFMG